ncbi:hypothetical protein EB232_22290 [Mesorhizobium sp. NZP2077]|nr:hypothetical protein EB232_22290 [Mesorhizobium sp. NZP2077]
MNWRRGLIRIWILSSAVWIGYIVWRLYSSCFEMLDLNGVRTGQELCSAEAWPHEGPNRVADILDFEFAHWLGWVSQALLPPLAVFLFAILVRWALNGFRRQTSN